MADAAILDARGLVAGYGGPAIVAGIDLELRAGAVLALIGGNGAGKSTLLRVLTGQTRPLAGRLTVCGEDVARAPERAKRFIGTAVAPDELPNLLTGRQYLEMVASIKGCASTAWAMPDLLDRLDLAPWLDAAIDACSLGTRGKLAIAAALLGAPPLLVFDESLNGLDPVAAFEVKAMIRNAAAAGQAAIIATHDLEIVPGLATEAMLLGMGGVQARWTAAELTAARHQHGAFEGAVIAALNAGRRRMSAGHEASVANRDRLP